MLNLAWKDGTINKTGIHASLPKVSSYNYLKSNFFYDVHWSEHKKITEANIKNTEIVIKKLILFL